MERQGTSSIVQYTRDGDVVTAHVVHRSWYRGAFVETARWLVPGGIRALRREPVPAPPGPLGYGRADLIAGGVIKPALHTFENAPCLHLKSFAELARENQAAGGCGCAPGTLLCPH